MLIHIIIIIPETKRERWHSQPDSRPPGAVLTAADRRNYEPETATNRRSG